MKIGVALICRFDSSRLPGKILMEIEGKAILQYIYERLASVCPPESIVVTTSDEPSDDPIVSYCETHEVNYFRGSKQNVAQRFLDCANHYDFDFMTRINGDNLFTDPETLRTMFELCQSDAYDFVSNVKGRTFPTGMSIEIARRTFYKDAITQFDCQDHFEHVTLFFYHNEKFGRRRYVTNDAYPPAAGMNMAIDEADDFALGRGIIQKMSRNHTTYGLQEICELAKSESA